MFDIIVKPEGPLARGSDRRASIRRHHGGSAANQAVWLAAKGVPVALVARVGDTDRASLDMYFRSRAVDPLLVADADRPTGALVTLVDTDGERSFLTDRGANLALAAADLPHSLLDGTSRLLLSGYSFFEAGPRAAVMALAGAANPRGIPFLVDAASVAFLQEVGRENFLGWTAGASLLFANTDEATFLAGTSDPDQQVRHLGLHFPRIVIKRGPLGAVIGGKDGVRTSLPALRVDVIDTTGAGDAFAAGFIAAEFEGHAEPVALSRAIAAGADAVRRLGGQPEN